LKRHYVTCDRVSRAVVRRLRLALRSDAERALGLLDDARKSEIIARQLGFLDPRLRLRFEP